MAGRDVRRRGTATRDALLHAATTVVERDGIAALTTRRVAQEAGLPLGTVHYWFADKAELLAGVIGVLLADVRARVVDGGGDDDGLADRLARLHERVMSMPVERQLALYEVTTHAIRTESLREVAREQYEAYTQAAVDGLGRWEATADATLPGGSRALAALSVAVIDGLTLAELAAPGDPDREAALRLFAHLLRGLEEARSDSPGERGAGPAGADPSAR